ncbi:NfeD family protein [Sphingobacterium hungaricum]
MNKITKSIWPFLLFFLVITFNGYAQKIYKVELQDEIGPNAWRTIKKAYEGAVEAKADYFLIDLNTFGGAVNFADSIRSQLLDSKIQTIVYVNNNAASAGALIALASDKIYMHNGGSIGAASVVNGSGEIMPEKYQSYMRGLMRATAEAKGRDPKIAEAFVDPEISLPTYKEDGKLLTFTATEAVNAGVAVAAVANENAIYTNLKIENPTVVQHEITFIDSLIALLINPIVSGLLILGIIGGIYMELQTPGIGFALVVALVCGALFFAPLYLQGLADNWEIALFVIGVILLALEIFVIPGFGLPGILGIIFMLCGLAFSMVSNDYLDFKFTQPGLLMNSFLIVVGAMVLTVVLMVLFGKDLLKSSAFKKLVLQDEQTAETGYTSSVPKLNLINRNGIAKTVLRPAGKIEIDDVWYDAVALDGFIDVGEEIYVEKHENYNLFVRRVVEKKA